MTMCKCGARDWTFDATGIYCTSCGEFRERYTKAEQRRSVIAAREGLTRFRKTWLERALAITVDDDTLAGWYAQQLTHLEGVVSRLETAVGHNLDILTEANDPRWRKWYSLVARYSYLYPGLLDLREAGHVLVCPNHGIPGVEWEASREEYEGLSLRGMLGGDRPFSWEWYCESCTPRIKRDADQMYFRHRQQADEPVPLDFEALWKEVQTRNRASEEAKTPPAPSGEPTEAVLSV